MATAVIVPCVPSGLDQAEVPGLGRSRVEDPEAVLAPAHGQLRLNLPVDDPFVAAGRSVADHLKRFVATVGGRAEALVGEDQRNVGDPVVAREAERARQSGTRGPDPSRRRR